MTPAFDVFRNDKSNCAIWLTAVNNLEEGEAHVRRLALDSPAEYFIFNQRTSIRHIVDATPRAARLPAPRDAIPFAKAGVARSLFRPALVFTVRRVLREEPCGTKCSHVFHLADIIVRHNVG